MFRSSKKTLPIISAHASSDNNPTKPSYVPPLIRTYQAQTLLRTLGPARAYSPNRDLSDDEFTLFGTMP